MKLRNVLFFLPLLLSSCVVKGGSNSSLIPVFHYENSVYKMADKEHYLTNWVGSEQLENLIKNKASFPLFVYAQGCSTCSDFPNILKAYIKKYQIVFPYTLLSSYLDLNIDKPALSQSALLFYKNGKIVKRYDDIENEVMTNEEFASLMQKHTVDTKVQILNPAKATIQKAGVFPYYSFTSDFTLYKDDIEYLPSLFPDEKSTDTCVLIVDDSKSFSFVDLNNNLTNNTDIVSLLFVGNENKKGNIKELINFELNAVFTKAKYQDNVLIESISLPLDSDR